MTADQVVGVRSTQMEEEVEELKRKNAELETQIVSIRCVAACSPWEQLALRASSRPARPEKCLEITLL